MNEETGALLKSMDAKLSALVALQTHRVLIEDAELARPRPRSIDKLLSDAGLTQAEIGAILGKSVQAVSQMIAKG
ncbi:MAG: hypothetical protein V3V29_03755 [Acidimicrobiia bacterium]